MPNGTLALQSADLTVGEGEIVALIGGSGCGKTTLLRLVSGLERPSAGQVLLDGQMIEAPHPAIGKIFQEARLLPWLTVADRVVVMQPRPGRIFQDLQLGLPRPRDPLSSQFLSEKRRILQALDGSLTRESSSRDEERDAVGLWW